MFRIRLPRFYPVFSWIQIEVTTKCNASCVYCPHYLCRSSWIKRDISFEIMKFIEPALPTTDLVYLQGWGEPLLYPDLWKMIEFLKKRNVRIGLTSNGTLITREIARRLVEAEVDIIAFSLAGTDETNDLIRKGTTLSAVKRGIGLINEEKKKQGTPLPRVHLAYLLLKSHFDQLNGLPSLLNELSLQEVVVSPLTLSLSPELDKEVCFIEELPEHKLIFLKELKGEITAQKLCERMVIHLVSKDITELCTEKIEWSMTISSDGHIHSCVLSMVPVKTKLIYYHLHAQCEMIPNEFGHFQDDTLKNIWYNKSYRSFRKRHLKENFGELSCSRCYKRRMVTI